MERLKTFLADIDKSELIQKLSTSDYSFAAWRLPDSKQGKLIVDLAPISRSNRNLSELEKGFVINKFSDSHPIHPHHIKADLIFEETIYINPKVGSDQLDSFEKFIKKEIEVGSALEHRRTESEEIPEFKQLVKKSIKGILEGHLDKIVPSRFKDVSLPDHFIILDFFDQLCDTYPSAFCNLVHLPGEGIWLGATPELLISNNENRFKTVAIAGTKELNIGQSLTEIAWTQKEIEEQAFVSRYIINCFKKIRLREFEEYGPKTIKAGNLAHLKTEFKVNFDEVSFEGLAEQMLELLHPTSAVCGMPLEEAREFIKNEERYDRAFYAGFLGPINFDGSTDLFVNLRCMNVKGDKARLYAGAGITEDSDPFKESIETELKMDTILSLIKK